MHMLEEKLRLIENRHKEEKNHLLDVINTNMINSNNMLRETLERKEKKEFVRNRLERAKPKVELDLETVAEMLRKNFKADDTKNNTNNTNNNKTNNNNTDNLVNNVPNKLRTFIPKTDTERVTNELLDIRDSIAKTLSDETYNTRKQLTSLQNNMKEMRANILNRMDLAEHRNRLNLETIKTIFEQGGGLRIRKAAREAFGGNFVFNRRTNR
jgi:hypothetical protein